MTGHRSLTLAALFLFMVTVLFGCSTVQPPVERVTPTPTALPVSVLTPDTNDVRYRPEPIIGQLGLATQIAADGTPRDERTSVPAGTQQLYLVVRVTDLPAGTRLAAVWIRGANEIGRSERQIADALQGSHWIALAFPSDVPLANGEYAVRLSVDDRFVDSLVFSVGQGSGTTSGQQTTLVFTDAPPGDGDQIRAFDVFPEGTTRVIAVLVDPPLDLQGNLWSRWTIDGQVLTERGADDLRSPFIRAFTLEREEPLPAGTYTVEVFAEQQLIAHGTFRITGATPTPTPSATTARIVDVRLVRAVQPGTGVPVGAAVQEIQSPARIYVALFVENLQANDLVEVVWQRAGTEIARQPLSGLTLSSSWIALPVDLPAETGSAPIPYSVTVLLNGEVVAQRSLLVVP